MKVTKFLKNTLFATVLLGSTVFAAENVGVVNLATCFEKSYIGKEEAARFDALRKDMVSMIETKQKEFQEIQEKLNDPSYLDSLSPQAEGDLRAQADNLAQELSLMGNQTEQALQQAYGKMIQSVQAEVNKAAEYIAREKNLDFILNEQSCFYFKKPTDVTALVVQELNRHFQPEVAKKEEIGAKK